MLSAVSKMNNVLNKALHSFRHITQPSFGHFTSMRFVFTLHTFIPVIIDFATSSGENKPPDSDINLVALG